MSDDTDLTPYGGLRVTDMGYDADLRPVLKTRELAGIFILNHCSVCDDGAKPCKQGRVNGCSNPIARNH